MNSFTDRLKEFLWERWTSPMYKGFIFSRILWNRNFLYILVFEDPQQILLETKKLKSVYLNDLYSLDFNSFLHLFLGPVLSMILFFYLFSRIELVIRKKARKIEASQKDADNEVFKADIEKWELINKEEKNNIEAMRLQFEKEIEMKKSEVEKIQLESQKTKVALENKQNEIDMLKKFQEWDISYEDQLIKNRTNEYNEASQISWFNKAISGLKILLSKNVSHQIWDDTYSEHVDIYSIYELCTYEYNEWYYITDKGKFFLRKFITNNSNIDKKLTPWNKNDISDNKPLDLEELPF